MNAPRSTFLRLFSSAVGSQALTSAASLAVGLILIRYTTDAQYGYYILVFNAILLLSALQNAFVGPAMVARMMPLDRTARGDLVGGLYRGQQRLLTRLGVLAATAAVVLWLLGLLDRRTAPLVLGAIVAGLAVLNREYFRLVLMAHHRPASVLRSDLPYVLLLVGGAALATLTPYPAVAAALSLGAAAAVGGALMFRALRRAEAWNPQGAPGILAQIAPLAAWSAAGAAVHWSFTQGYSYLVAGTLDVAAVAALAATRLLMMPLNLVSTGIGAQMLPLASRWRLLHGSTVVLRRLALFAVGMAIAALCYFGLMWLLRDWIFAVVLKKDFAQRDAMLLLWSGIFLLMVMRDQLIYLLLACERYRSLTAMSALSAVLSLALSFIGMQYHGLVGALWGMLVGEAVNLLGIILLSLRETGQWGGLRPALQAG